MFCGKCGAKNPDEAAFCSACGAKLNEGQKVVGGEAAPVEQMPVEQTPVTEEKNSKNKKVGIIAVAVIAIAAIAGIFALFGGKGYEAVAEDFVEAYYTADAAGIVELIPEKMVDYTLEDEGYDSLDAFIEEGNETLEAQMYFVELYLGENLTVTSEILGVEDVSEDDLPVLKVDYEYYGIKVSEAKYVEIEYTVKGSEDEMTDTLEIPVIKIGSSWYLDVDNMGVVF